MIHTQSDERTDPTGWRDAITTTLLASAQTIVTPAV
jgi:hypothetical protein